MKLSEIYKSKSGLCQDHILTWELSCLLNLTILPYFHIELPDTFNKLTNLNCCGEIVFGLGFDWGQ
jgi:hypothetical protein